MRKTLKVVAFGGGPADAFIKAAGITDSTQQTAIKTLVNDLNGYGLWSKMKAIYPMVGGNATAHSYNLKDITKFQITWNGGITHSSTGVLPNGTNGYGDTSLIPSSSLSANNIHLGYYSRTNSAVASSSTMGSDDALSERCRIVLRRTGDLAYTVIGNPTVGLSTFTVTDSKGLFIGNAPNSATRKFYKNGSSLTAVSQSGFGTNGLSQRSIYLCCFNNNNFAVEYDNKECAFATIGDGLTDTEASNLYTIIQNYQTILNRQV